MATHQIAIISKTVIDALSLNCQVGTPIYLGDSNISHMKARHFSDYQKYHSYISVILSSPEYVGINPKDDSIEYVREFISEKEYVKVAVRVSLSGNYFVRSLYILNSNRARNFIANGTLKDLTD